MPLKKGFMFSIENKRFNKLFFRIFCTATLVSFLLTLFFGGYTYYTSKRTFSDKIENSNNESLYYIKNVVDDAIRNMDKIAINTKLQSSVEKFILSGTANQETLNNIKEYIENYRAIYRYIHSVYIYEEKGKHVFMSKNDILQTHSIEEFHDIKWYKQYQLMDCNSVSIYEHTQKGSYPYLLTIIRPVSFNRKDKAGAVVINLDVIELTKLLKHENDKQKIFLISDDGNIVLSCDRKYIFQNEENEDYKQLLKNKSMYISKAESDYNNWQYIMYDFSDEYEEEWISFFWQNIIVCIIFFVISLFVTYILTVRNYKPISNIVTFVDKTNIDTTKLEESQHTGNKYADKLVSMLVGKHSKKDDEIIKMFMSYNDAQIMALQSQIKAHFLHNILLTIQWRAYEMTETENDVSIMICKLGKFLKSSVEINTSILTVDEEIANAMLYTDLMLMRYEDVFCVNWDIDEDALEFKCINICLQPIIENAIEHGLRRKNTKGTLTIKVKAYNDFIHFYVIDDGIGIEHEKVTELNRKLLDEKAEYDNSHIGLSNVAKRLKMMFGTESSISIESEEKVGTTVKVVFSKVR